MTAAGAVLALGVAIWRLSLVESLPVITGDVVRNLLYGVGVSHWGVSAAASPLAALSPRWAGASWAHLPYSYPPLALAFFVTVASVSPTVYAVKLALTVVEAANAVLIARLGESRLLGLLYWCAPASLWWVSREGQFEPLQSLFSLLALWFAPSAPLAAGLCLAASIQVKVTALALVPWLAHRCLTSGRRSLALAAIGLAAGLLPSLGAELAYGGISNVFRFGAPLMYNPYYWNWTAPMFSWNPGWLVFCDEFASYAMLAALLAYAALRRSLWSTAAPIAFLVFCKVHTNVQFWYFLLLAPLLVPIEDRRWRFALIAAVPLLDVSAAVSLLWQPVGEHGYRGLPSVYATYEVPPP